jgi:hypothetical protein
MKDREIVLFLGAGASKLCGLPTVEHFFEKVDAPSGRGFKDLYERLARRIAIEEGTEQGLNWPNYDAEKLFGKLEQWVNTASIAGEPPIARLRSVKNFPSLSRYFVEFVGETGISGFSPLRA